MILTGFPEHVRAQYRLTRLIRVHGPDPVSVSVRLALGLLESPYVYPRVVREHEERGRRIDRLPNSTGLQTRHHIGVTFLPEVVGTATSILRLRRGAPEGACLTPRRTVVALEESLGLQLSARTVAVARQLHDDPALTSILEVPASAYGSRRSITP